MYRLLRAYSKQYLVLLFDQSVFSEKEYRHHEESCFFYKGRRGKTVKRRVKQRLMQVSVQHNNGGFLHGTYYTVGPNLTINTIIEELLYLQPMILSKRVDIFPPDWGMLIGLDAFSFFF